MKGAPLIAIVVAVLAGSVPPAADEAISMTVRPTVATYPGTAELKVLVARDAKNRALVWEVDGPALYRRSTMQLDGASSPRSYFFMLRDLPSGEFEVRATLVRNDDRSILVRSHIQVVGGPG